VRRWIITKDGKGLRLKARRSGKGMVLEIWKDTDQNATWFPHEELAEYAAKRLWPEGGYEILELPRGQRELRE
jgi:hypothetical protein